jgi:hypothetical protein
MTIPVWKQKPDMYPVLFSQKIPAERKRDYINVKVV